MTHGELESKANASPIYLSMEGLTMLVQILKSGFMTVLDCTCSTGACIGGEIRYTADMPLEWWSIVDWFDDKPEAILSGTALAMLQLCTCPPTNFTANPIGCRCGGR